MSGIPLYNLYRHVRIALRFSPPTHHAVHILVSSSRQASIMHDTRILESLKYTTETDTKWSEFCRNFLPYRSGSYCKRWPDFAKAFPKRPTHTKTSVMSLQNNLLDVLNSQRLCVNFKFCGTDRFTPGSASIAIYPRRVHVHSDAEAWAVLEFHMLVTDIDLVRNLEEVLCEEYMNVHNQFEHQHRTSVFTVMFSGTTVRIARWDRAGVVVTRPTDLVANPEVFADFLRRYDSCWNDPEARGFDSTATPASYAEACLLTDAMRDYLGQVKAGLTPLFPHPQYVLDKTFPAYRINMGDQADCDIIVRGPFFTKAGLIDSGTRGFVGYCLHTKRLVFVKDFWEKNTKESEVGTYKELIACNVTHIPSVVSAVVVASSRGGKQHTLSHRLLQPGAKRIHTRIAQEMLFPITEAKNSRQLIEVFRDAIQALNEAYYWAGRNHGDISRQNIMMTADGRGVLNDWDCSFPIGLSPVRRKGTWPYMSCDLLAKVDRGRSYIQGIKDDLEACFWVLWDLILHHYIPRDAFPADSDPLSMLYEKLRDRKDRKYGGHGKRAFLHSLTTVSELDLPVPCQPLKDLLFEFGRLIGHFYLAREFLNDEDSDDDENESLPRSLRLQISDAKAARAALDDARRVLKLFDYALGRGDWIKDDRLEDQWSQPGSEDRLELTSYLGIPGAVSTAEVVGLVEAIQAPAAMNTDTESEEDRPADLELGDAQQSDSPTLMEDESEEDVQKIVDERSVVDDETSTVDNVPKSSNKRKWKDCDEYVSLGTYADKKQRLEMGLEVNQTITYLSTQEGLAVFDRVDQ